VRSNPAALRALREAKGHSQSSLARETGVAQTRISRLERLPEAGIRPPTAKKLADALGVSISAITINDLPHLDPLESVSISGTRP
jgi:transcriptional regulator with XRE-family HTH domain